MSRLFPPTTPALPDQGEGRQRRLLIPEIHEPKGEHRRLLSAGGELDQAGIAHRNAALRIGPHPLNRLLAADPGPGVGVGVGRDSRQIYFSSLPGEARAWHRRNGRLTAAGLAQAGVGAEKQLCPWWVWSALRWET